ncbi:enoyl-CoA hydratase/isomerase family protein [Novosphingobium sp. G106]|nr:enoyl-CoA hydratase-related protein [Novosphingobium sp. G106]MBV1688878.1 enoyl-CoA hydratase/isomerase family protein [Novosphingobium sp. G106]
MSEAPVLFDVAGDLARITLNRPEVGNAIDLSMARALFEVATRCLTDASIRCVVLTGAGRLFCAGGDVDLFRSSSDNVDALLSDLAGTLHAALAALARMPKPLLVLVNGPAAGAGLSLAIMGDVVLSSASAHFTAAYGGLGLTPDGGMSWWLPRLVGLRKAQEIILTDRRIKSAEAEAIGLVTRVVADGTLASEGELVACNLAKAATAALGAARSLLRTSFETSYETQLANELQSIVRAGGSSDCREGLAAYFEKRSPDFGPL